MYSSVGRQATSATSRFYDAAIDLSGKRVLLTGASGGLGEPIARALAQREAKLVLSGRREEPLAALARELDAEVAVCDLADRSAVERLVAESGDVDVLVANAGLLGAGTLPRLDPDEIDRVIDVNLRAPIALARRLLPAMVDRGEGHLVFVASFAGKVSSAGESPIYTATKSGLRGFAHVLRVQSRRKGVGVSIVTPGPIRDVGMWARGGQKLPGFIRPQAPEDVGKAVVRAVEEDLAEVDVASFGLRVVSKLSALAPAWFAARSGR